MSQQFFVMAMSLRYRRGGGIYTRNFLINLAVARAFSKINIGAHWYFLEQYNTKYLNQYSRALNGRRHLNHGAACLNNFLSWQCLLGIGGGGGYTLEIF